MNKIFSIVTTLYLCPLHRQIYNKETTYVMMQSAWKYHQAMMNESIAADEQNCELIDFME